VWIDGTTGLFKTTKFLVLSDRCLHFLASEHSGHATTGWSGRKSDDWARAASSIGRQRAPSATPLEAAEQHQEQETSTVYAGSQETGRITESCATRHTRDKVAVQPVVCEGI